MTEQLYRRRAGEPVTLAECPVGLFECGDELCLKSEYSSNEGRIDAYIVSSGEFFWGAAPQTIASQRATMVTPVEYEPLPAPAPDAREALEIAREALEQAAVWLRGGDYDTRGGMIEMSRLASVCETALARIGGGGGDDRRLDDWLVGRGALPAYAVSGSPDAREALDEATLTVIYEALRFADWAAGEGIYPDIEGRPESAEFLSDFIDAKGLTELDYADLPEYVRQALARIGGGA